MLFDTKLVIVVSLKPWMFDYPMQAPETGVKVSVLLFDARNDS
jgi:hypothetical protein